MHRLHLTRSAIATGIQLIATGTPIVICLSRSHTIGDIIMDARQQSGLPSAIFADEQVEASTSAVRLDETRANALARLWRELALLGDG